MSVNVLPFNESAIERSPTLLHPGTQTSALGWAKRVGRGMNVTGTEGLGLGPEAGTEIRVLLASRGQQ